MTPAVPTLEQLGEARTVLLTSYRRDGSPVGTPVWVARDGDALVVWTVTGSYKVRRIRRNPSVTLAPCTQRGRPLGEAVAGQATILDAAGAEHVRRLIRKKYGLVGRLTVGLSVIRRGRDGTVGVRVVLA